MPFQIIRADITSVKADAIVITLNSSCEAGNGGVSDIFKTVSEKRLVETTREIVYYESEVEIVIVPAAISFVKYIIYADVPHWEGREEGTLRRYYNRLLELARDKGCESIVFPLFSFEVVEFPRESVIQIAVDSFTRFLEENDIDITMVVPGNSTDRISGELAQAVRPFIDEKSLSEEYFPAEASAISSGLPVTAATKSRKDGVSGGVFDHFGLHRKCSESEEAYEPDGFCNIPDGIEEDLPFDDVHYEQDDALALGAMPMESAYASLEDVLKGMYADSFEKHLQQLINKKGLKNSEVYAAANISRQYFSKLIKGQVKPSKEKVLALAVGLQLNMDETADFMRMAGYALSPISQTDVIVEYFIRHEDYNVMKIDIVLFDYGLEPLSGS